jgi:hypothetical protein
MRSSGKAATAPAARSGSAGSTCAAQVLLTAQPDTSATSSQQNDSRSRPLAIIAPIAP